MIDNAQFPEKLEPLFIPKRWRYKILAGGRGGAKSWGIARALLILGAGQRLRVLCTREVQLSIKDSVHRLLKDQVSNLGLDGFYSVIDTEIRGANGTLFLFSGLSSNTTESIKSFEGCDICWIEEGQTISKRSWDILTPTIRKPGSEIWVSMNPELETDETYQRFIATPSDDTLVISINYPDNPWFPDVLEAERQRAKRDKPIHEYEWIWEGKTLPAAEGAIYHREISMMQENGHIRAVPFDPLLKTHTIWDLGFNDNMAIIIAQRAASEIRICRYIEDNRRTISQYVADLRQIEGINWGFDFIPHDGAAKNIQTGKSAYETLQALGRDPQMVPGLTIETGIRSAREIFSRVYIDESATQLINCLKNYKRQKNQQTGEFHAPLHDQYSHGADAFRYLSLIADKMTNEQWGGDLDYQELGVF